MDNEKIMAIIVDLEVLYEREDLNYQLSSGHIESIPPLVKMDVYSKLIKVFTGVLDDE